MEQLASSSPEPAALLARYQALKSETPRLFPRDAARQLGVSEGELMAARCGQGVTRLDGNWHDLVRALDTIGRVMCLTRNDWVVHERKGTYEDIRVREVTGAAIGPEIDLRYDFRHWSFAFAVVDETDHGTRESLQFFGPDGTAVHEIYKTDDTDAAGWAKLIADRTGDDQTPGQTVTATEPAPAEAPDDTIDVDGMRDMWRNMKNTHQFPGMMKKFGVNRPQCLRLAGPEFAEQLDQNAIRRTLEGASANNLTLMIFVVNRGATQIHTGVPGNLKEVGEWFNVLDPDFNLHLLPKGIHSAWLVRKRYELGTSRSVEAYDEHGEPILWIFGKRNADGTEPEAWRDFAETLTGSSSN